MINTYQHDKPQEFGRVSERHIQREIQTLFINSICFDFLHGCKWMEWNVTLIKCWLHLF